MNLSLHNGQNMVTLDSASMSYTAEQQTVVDFASASARGKMSTPLLTVSVAKGGALDTAEDVERITLRVPHSWWPQGGQPFCPHLAKGDILILSVESGIVDVRLDVRLASALI